MPVPSDEAPHGERLAVPVLDKRAAMETVRRQDLAGLEGGEQLVAGEPAGLVDLVTVDAISVVAPGQEAEHEAGRERPGLAGEVLERATAIPTSSRTSRATACSRDSPGSTKPARVEKRRGGQRAWRPSRTRSASSTTAMITAGSVRG